MYSRHLALPRSSERGRLLSNAKNLLHYFFIHVINSHVKINMDPDTLVYEGIKQMIWVNNKTTMHLVLCQSKKEERAPRHAYSCCLPLPVNIPWREVKIVEAGQNGRTRRKNQVFAKFVFCFFSLKQSDFVHFTVHET